MKSKINHRRRQFIENYIIDQNATRAYESVYNCSNRTAQVNGEKLLRIAEINSEIQSRLKKKLELIEMDSTRVLQELAHLASANLTDAYNTDGTLKKISEMPESVKRALTEIQYDDEGNIKKIKMLDKTKSLDMLCRHLQLYNDKISIVADVSTMSDAQLENIISDERSIIEH